jgi:hypothetical protein
VHSGQGSISAMIDSWVRSLCTQVPATDYSAAQSSAIAGFGNAQTLKPARRAPDHPQATHSQPYGP